MWPRTVEFQRSYYPRHLRSVALSLSGVALLLSGLPLSLMALLGLAALAAVSDWRPACLKTAIVSPGAVRLLFTDGRRVTLTPPFRVMMHQRWLALHCPGQGWVWLFADQAPPERLTPLRQVLYLQRR